LEENATSKEKIAEWESLILIWNVITEISSAQGDKNSASSTQKNSHSWHKVNSTAQQKGSKLYKMAKKLQGALHPLGARARA
jgi:hypothetical protein